LGLSKLEANRIFSQADSTIHSAAEVSHLKSYSNLHDTNVASTKELTRLCLPRRIPIHYVSTAGVAMFAVGDTFDEVSASSTPPPTDGGDGYSASKWASERFLERVNAVFDLPVWIHRPSGIMRPPNEKHNQDALLLSILHFSKRSELCQRLTSSKGHWIVFIENVSRNIVKDVLENNPWTPNGLSYIHQTGDIVIPLDQMKEYIERESEEPLPVVEKLTLTEWAERAELVGLHSSLANVLKNADQIGILQMHIPKLVRKYRN
jgi:hybrid polyketide synthase / nonribosomal peptide synthetase ACE1